jgi:hypothetical protein
MAKNLRAVHWDEESSQAPGPKKGKKWAGNYSSSLPTNEKDVPNKVNNPNGEKVFN